MFLVLVTDKVTIPLGFSFYEPDPKWMKWSATDKKLKKQVIKYISYKATSSKFIFSPKNIFALLSNKLV